MATQRIKITYHAIKAPKAHSLYSVHDDERY